MSAPEDHLRPHRLEDDRADAYREWIGWGGTREEFEVFWPLIRDRLLAGLRENAA